MRSGATPYGSIAHQLPVRPAPHKISSATKSTSCRSQISRIVRKYSGRGVDAPVDEPPTGSALNAAPVSAPARPVACSSRAPLQAGRGGELAGELLHRAVGECGARDVAELARLARQRLRDLRIRVAEIRDVGAAHGVEVALPLLVVQPAALTPHNARVAAAELAVEDVAIGIAVVRHSSPLPLPRRPGSAESYAAACISARERRSFVYLHLLWVRICPSSRVYFLH